MEKNHIQVRCLPCSRKSGERLKQTLEWLVLAKEAPPEMDTVLLATENSLALGYVSLEGNLVIEHVPLDQEEGEGAEPEFLYWMPLPQTPIRLMCRNNRELKVPITIQLRLWSEA